MMTIALAQIRGDVHDKKINITRAVSIMESCLVKGVDYVLFPELFLTGYFIHDWVEEVAEPANGESIRKLQQHARELGIGLIIGFPEREQGKIYNSAAFIDKDGSVKEVYRKVHLFHQEKQVYTPGEDFPVIQLDVGKIAIMMTFDLEFPEMARIYAVNGVELILVLNAHHVPYEPHQELFLRTRAVENQLFIAAANKVGLEKSTLYFGKSAIISPEGAIIASGGNNEEIIIATVNLGEVYRIREEHAMKYLENRRTSLYLKKGLLGE